MNSVNLIGRLTRDPDTKYIQREDKPQAVAKFTLAINRSGDKGSSNADFISVTAFGSQGEFAEKYLRKGMRIGVSGRIATGNYTNKDGVKVYTYDVIVKSIDFADGKDGEASKSVSDTFDSIDDGDEYLPFN